MVDIGPDTQSSQAMTESARGAPSRKPNRLTTFLVVVGLALGFIAVSALWLRPLSTTPTGSSLLGDSSGAPGTPSNSPPDSAAPITNVEDARLAIVEAVNTDRENFGGVYLDAAGTLVIQYVGLNAGADAVQARMDRAVPVRWVKVDRSRADLENVMTAIREGNFPGVMISELDTINNQVKVTCTQDDFANVSQILATRFGASVSVTPGDPAVILPSYTPMPD